MISPQEAESKVFSKASFGGGYHMAQVDAFLDELLGDYSALYKENVALKNKMKVMAEKLEEYRSTEDAMRKTLLSAQKMADSMLREAESKKTEAIGLAERETRTRIDEIRRDVQSEELRLNAARKQTSNYLEKLRGLHEQQGNFLERLDDLAQQDTPQAAPQAPNSEAPPAAAAAAAAAPLAANAEADESLRVPEPPNAGPEGDEDVRVATPASDIDSDTVIFDRLEFGRDYQFE